MENTKQTDSKSLAYKAVAIVAITGSLTLALYSLSIIKQMKYIGAGIAPTNTITVTGKADKYVAPDIAKITFTSRSTDKKVSVAQGKVNEQVKSAIDKIKGLGIDAKDIKTTNVYSYPKYTYGTVICTVGMAVCPPQKTILDGYEYSQTTEVKIKNIEKVGDVLDALGAVEITEVSGPDFSVDNIDTVKDGIRSNAIDNAKEKAHTLAKELGVDLVRITSFNETSGDYYPQPMYSKMAGMASSESVSSADTINVGENKITSQVTITYEIR